APPATAKIGAMVQMHQCCGSCGVHGHQHDIARKSSIQVSDEQVKVPLVLHGGTGIADEDMRRAIACGTAKINVNTENMYAWC
ncbi:class II fructose-bisphosphate aldolase, partial [Klebsiella pneumoniae]|uniref:class II fructose-bisphosphate aldolase n=1 Tax=Klebsiella pneumoniae TaxID=573 RepID=UPI003EE3274A